MSNCLFCAIAEGEIEAEILHRDSELVAFEDINPQAPVHLLIIPRRHIASVNQVGEGDRDILGRMFELAAELAESSGVKQEGYRLIVNCGDDAGQDVQHLHLHLLGGRGMGWPPG